ECPALRAVRLAEGIYAAVEGGRVDSVAGDRRRGPHLAVRASGPARHPGSGVGGDDLVALRSVVDRVAVNRDAADELVSRLHNPPGIAAAGVQGEDIALERRHVDRR